MAVRPATPMKMPSTTSSVRPLRRVTSASDLRRLALKSLMPHLLYRKDDRAGAVLPDGSGVPLAPLRQRMLALGPQFLADEHHLSSGGPIDAGQQIEQGGLATAPRPVDGNKVLCGHRADEAV